MNTRRKLLLALGATALASPLTPHAQPQTKVWRVGFLSTQVRPDSLDTDNIGALLRGMRELGYVEGKNLTIEWRFAGGKYERLPDLAAELMQLKVDAIVVTGGPATKAAQKATATIPIVMVNNNNPVGDGFVASLAHPGGNTTGLTTMAGELNPKHLEMLRGMVPKLSRVAFLANPANPAYATTLKNIQAGARSVGVTLLPLEARTPQEIEQAFAAMTREKAGACIVHADGFLNQQRRQIAELALKHRLPSIFGRREYAEAGGLMSYGPNYADNYRRGAIFVDKIFKGAKPGDIPVEQPTIFELFINGKTAKALGLKIPQSLLISADKVIE